MRIAIASGKGGTGKTTVATNLAHIASRNGLSVAYFDCDVEEPNGHIFLKPEITDSRSVGNLIPEVDKNLCTNCGKCGEICQFSAIVCVGEKVLVYPELCHACGGCTLVCPVDAIRETVRLMAKLETGHAGPIKFAHGLLNVGEVMSPPVIRAVKKMDCGTDLLIVDAPPGTSCPAIESVRNSDFVVLVTEPTPFGLNDLKLTVEMIQSMELSFGVVINRCDVGDHNTKIYCDMNDIEILAEIPDDRKIAEAYSRGEMICETIPKYESLFAALLEKIEKEHTDNLTGDGAWRKN